jgi:hypothetical protein
MPRRLESHGLEKTKEARQTGHSEEKPPAGIMPAVE